jgi:hypothetical protein
MKKAFKILEIIILTAVIGFSMTACQPEEIDEPEDTAYIITGAPGAFTATKSGEAVTGAENAEIDAVLTAIKADAKGGDITVQFGNGADVLDLGTGYTSNSEGVAPTGHPGAIFNGTGWGTVTVTGKVKANRGGLLNNQLVAHTVGFNGVNGVINADITNTNSSWHAVGVRNTTLIVKGGTITGGNGSGYGIDALNESVVTVDNGTIQGYIGINLNNIASAIVNGGMITGTSSSMINSAGIYLNSNTLTVTGGTIKGTGTMAAGIYCSTGGTITLSGTGTVITSAIDSGDDNDKATIILNNGGAGSTIKTTLTIGADVIITNTSTGAGKLVIFNRGDRATVVDNRINK